MRMMMTSLGLFLPKMINHTIRVLKNLPYVLLLLGKSIQVIPVSQSNIVRYFVILGVKVTREQLEASSDEESDDEKDYDDEEDDDEEALLNKMNREMSEIKNDGNDDEEDYTKLFAVQDNDDEDGEDDDQDGDDDAEDEDGDEGNITY